MNSITKAFVLGNPRSGTTLFRLMLNSHRRIAAPPECGFMQWWFRKYEKWTKKDSQDEGRLEMFVSDLTMSKKIETWDLDRARLIDYIRQKEPQNYGDLCAAIYVYWSTLANKEVLSVVDKNNYYIDHLDTIVRIWPDAKFLVLVRDGRDVACSYLDLNSLETNSPYKPLLPVEIGEIAKSWVVNNEKLMAFVAANRTNALQIKFEDLILDAPHTLQRVCDFLGMEFDEEMLEYYETDSKYQSEPQITLDWKRKTQEKPDSTVIGRYRSKLSDEEVKLFNSIARELLIRFGYDA